MNRLLVLCLLAFAAHAETRVTLCQTTEVSVVGDVIDRRLTGCGEGFSNNLLWHLDRSDSVSGGLDAREQFSSTGRGAVVYVIDTGIRADHEEFARATGSNVIAGIIPPGKSEKDCANPALSPCWGNSSNILKLYSHGTAVASMVAGARVGVAPDASIVSVVGPIDGDVNWMQTMDAIIAHAFAPTTPQFRTAIINISGGAANISSDGLKQVEASIRKMISGVDASGNPDPNGKRFLFVTAAGNSTQCTSTDGVAIIPGILGTSIDGLITVGGLSRANDLWSGSCKGALVEVLAPAEDLFLASLAANDLYRYQPSFFVSGTSYATPYVSGMAARLLQINPELTPQEIESLLKQSPSRVAGYAVPVTIPPHADKRRSVR